MLKAAIEKIEQMCKPQLATIDCNDYIIDRDGGYTQIKPDLDLPEEITLSSLDAVVTMVRTEAVVKLSKTGTPLFISVPSATKVSVYSAVLSPEKRNNRITFYEAKATDVPGWEPSVKLPFDQAAWHSRPVSRMAAIVIIASSSCPTSPPVQKLPTTTRE